MQTVRHTAGGGDPSWAGLTQTTSRDRRPGGSADPGCAPDMVRTSRRYRHRSATAPSRCRSPAKSFFPSPTLGIRVKRENPCSTSGFETRCAAPYIVDAAPVSISTASVVPVDHRFALSNPALVSAPSKQSFSSVSWPILACGGARPTGSTLSAPPPKSSAACFSNWGFQSVIWLGCSSNCLASSRPGSCLHARRPEPLGP